MNKTPWYPPNTHPVRRGWYERDWRNTDILPAHERTICMDFWEPVRNPIFGSGFPKSKNLDGDWKGWGTALKPAHEPICLARKPLVGTVTANVLAHGTGALNIDACRVPITNADDAREFDYNHNGCNRSTVPAGGKLGMHDGGWKVRKGDVLVPEGRWPANLIHDGSPEVVALFPDKAGGLAPVTGNENSPASRGLVTGERARVPWIPHGDTSSAARFFYCTKITRSDRNEGLEGRDKKALNWSSGTQSPGSLQSPGTDKTAENHHPTVKPTELMAYLVRLVTPPNGTVLDPFMGSGSTGKACMREGFNFVGIELDPEYVEIARARIEWARPRQFGLQLEPAA